MLIYPKFNTREKSYDYLLIIYMQKFEWLFLLNLSPIFLFKVRRARVIKYKPRGIYGPPVQGGSVSRAPRSFSRAGFARALADVLKQRLCTV